MRVPRVVEHVAGERAVRDRPAERQHLVLGEVFEEVAHDQDRHLVADDHHPLAFVFAGDRVTQRTQPQRHVDPALPAGRPMVELAEPLAAPRFTGEAHPHPVPREQIEDAQLAFAQPLVEVDLESETGRRADALGRLRGADVRRGDDDVGHRRLSGEPPAQRGRLLDAELGQGDVHVTVGDVQRLLLIGARPFANHVALALTVAHQPQLRRLWHAQPLPGRDGGYTRARRHPDGSGPVVSTSQSTTSSIEPEVSRT